MTQDSTARGDKPVALVTGASRGIGLAVAERLAAGFFVVGTATSAAGAEHIGERLGSAGAGLELELGDPASVESAIAELTERYGAPLVLVNNAGITRDNLLMRMKPDEWSAVIDVNLGGLYRVVKPLLRGMMKARWGRIVNISSVVASMGNAGQSNYVASKAGIEGFTRALAQELASRNITVNAVAPGFIETDMTDALTEDQSAQMLARIPLGRMGKAEDVAGAVAYLVSEAGSYVTGSTLHVNGGLHMA